MPAKAQVSPGGFILKRLIAQSKIIHKQYCMVVLSGLTVQVQRQRQRPGAPKCGGVLQVDWRQYKLAGK